MTLRYISLFTSRFWILHDHKQRLALYYQTGAWLRLRRWRPSWPTHRTSCSWLQHRYLFDEHLIQRPLHHIIERLANRFHRCIQWWDARRPIMMRQMVCLASSIRNHGTFLSWISRASHEDILLFSIRSAIQIERLQVNLSEYHVL